MKLGPLAGRWSIAATIVGLLAGIAAGAEGPLRLPDDPPPAALAALTPLDGVLAIALTEDGAQAAVAFRHVARDRSSALHLADAGGSTRVLEIKGTVVDLLFSPSGTTLFALVRRGKPSRARESFLYTVDVASLAGTRAVTLPSSATALELWPGGRSLLIACRDEVRTVLLPELRSGPLFAIRGGNLSMASVPGGNSLLIGQAESLSRYDLSDPQGRDAMAARERVEMPAPVVALAPSPDGLRALARLEDGRTYDVELAPLRLSESGSSTFIAWLGHPIPPREEAVRLQPLVAAAEADAPPLQETAEAAPVEPPSSTPPASPEPPAEPRAEAPVAAADSQPEGTEGDERHATLEGGITGPQASLIRAVVLLGPDNVMREAARVVPDASGRWRVEGLEPGRYRVVLDAGGHSVSVRPPFHTVRVAGGDRSELDPFEVLREL